MSRLDDAISDVAYILDSLMAYRKIVETGCCNDCESVRVCGYKPDYGKLVRYNCPFYVRRDEEGEK